MAMLRASGLALTSAVARAAVGSDREVAGPNSDSARPVAPSADSARWSLLWRGGNWASTAGPWATASAASPGRCRTARTSPTRTFSAPAGTTILVSAPSSGASRSTVVLSASISAMTSPARTESPSRFFQATTAPSVIASVRFGIRISVGMARLG